MCKVTLSVILYQKSQFCW